MIKKITMAGAVVAATVLSGCATIISGTTQTINVQAIDSKTNQIIPGATCSITDDKGRIYVISSNPGSVIVTKGQGSLNLKCEKAGYRQTQVGVGENFNAWTVANVLFWPGALVDAATGAIQKYPSHLTAIMERTRR